jgi:uncharacterized protein DUF4416
MWEVKRPDCVKPVVGILASDDTCLTAAREALAEHVGAFDLVSRIWPFTQTRYYRDQTGPHILRQFVSFEALMHPGELADLKHRTNAIEKELSGTLTSSFQRPVNLDPGIVEPSKLVLASTKNFSHRIYIGRKMYAEVTLVFDKGAWCPLRYTYPDYRQKVYFEFFSEVRETLLRQLKSATHEE